MIINFCISNFLSFNNPQTFSMLAGKTRRNADRLFKSRDLRLTKCEVLFGGNASGKSNLVYAFQFVQDMVINGLPYGFSNKYFRQCIPNQEKVSTFSIELLIGNTRVEYGFEMLLRSGSIHKEYMYQISSSDKRRLVYERSLVDGFFAVGDYFRSNSVGAKRLTMYGDDSITDSEMLFINAINHGKTRLFDENDELNILRDVYDWFKKSLTVSTPDSVLKGYPYFSKADLNEITKIIHAMGLGINDLKIVDVPVDVIKRRIPEDLYQRIVSDLEKNSIREVPNTKAVMLRSFKEFYTFDLDESNQLRITTIEFSHENRDVYFGLLEESDGTARLLDLIEILLKVSEDSVFVIDEIDRCLHPALTSKLIELFLELAKYRNTQLVITSHESRLLAAEILRNDEICFVVKNNQGESILNPLDEYQLRSDKKVYAAMFDGTLANVIPEYDDDAIISVLK